MQTQTTRPEAIQRSGIQTPESVHEFCSRRGIDCETFAAFALYTTLEAARKSESVLEQVRGLSAMMKAAQATSTRPPLDIDSPAFLEALATEMQPNGEFTAVLSNGIPGDTSIWRDIITAAKQMNYSRSKILHYLFWFGTTALNAYNYNTDLIGEHLYDDIRAGIAARKEKGAK